MTYCIGMLTGEGLVMLADTRTNAGVDNISTFRKLTVWEAPGDRVIALAAAGNLSISQTAINLVDEGVENPDTGEIETIHTVPSMFRAAQMVGRAIRAVYRTAVPGKEGSDPAFSTSLLLGGQIASRQVRLFHVYAEGNFIEATPDTPFFQIGEHKYGKPILDRVFSYRTPLVDGVKLALISMDSTLRSNLSVGLPCDLLVYRRDALAVDTLRRIGEDDPYFTDIRQAWSDALRNAYGALPVPPWMGVRDADIPPPGR